MDGMEASIMVLAELLCIYMYNCTVIHVIVATPGHFIFIPQLLLVTATSHGKWDKVLTLLQDKLEDIDVNYSYSVSGVAVST